VREDLGRLGCQQEGLGRVELTRGGSGSFDRRTDLLGIERNALALALDDTNGCAQLVLVHRFAPSFRGDEPRGE
jgi:hypothetical protein